jgi:phosphogluconate dehydratase
VRQALDNSVKGTYRPTGEIVDARSFVNALVGLMATGGSTNHALHIPAMAAAAGYEVTLEDFADVSEVVPLLCRIYPNGPADVNQFHAAGGMGFVVAQLLKAGLMHGDALGAFGPMSQYSQEPWLDGDTLKWREAPTESGDLDIVRPVEDPFSATGGLQMLDGPLGRGVIKISTVKPERYVTEAPARVFESQEAVKAAFSAGELDRDVVIVVRFQGPAANGMPELHGLSGAIGALHDKGHKVALVTDGRMSGASGKFPAAIHVGPEASRGGPLARVQDGDIIRLDAVAGRLDVQVDPREFEGRNPVPFRPNNSSMGLGREMFGGFRAAVSNSEQGGSVFSMLGGT